MSETPGQQPSPPSRAKRIAWRWAIIFVGLLLLAGVEGVVLWMGGVRYEPDSDFISVSVGDLSFDANGDRAAALVHFKRRSTNVGVWRDVVLLNLRDDDPVRLGVRDFAPACVAMSPCSKSIVFAGRSRKIFSIDIRPVLKPKTARPIVTVFAESCSPRIKRLVFSPNGKYLAAASRDSVFVWDYTDGRLLHHFPHSDTAFESIGFSPDSHIVFSSRGSLGPCLWGIQSGEIVESFRLFGQQGLRTAWSFDARLLAAATPGEVSVFGSDSRERLWGIPASRSEPGGTFSPRGRLLAYVGRSGRRSGIHLCESASGSQVGWLNTHGSSIKGILFSPDGRLYAWDVEGTIRAWDEKCPTHVWSFSVLEWASHANWPASQSALRPSRPDHRQTSASGASGADLMISSGGREQRQIEMR